MTDLRGEIRLLGLDDVDAYLTYVAIRESESGSDGESAEHPQPLTDLRASFLERWSTPVGAPRWRRTWGLWFGKVLAGAVHLVGDESIHRCELGIGIERDHRGEGWGRGLVEVAIRWAQAEPSIDWIDLEVFEANVVAIALYDKLEFVECGRKSELVRMMLRVGSEQRP